MVGDILKKKHRVIYFISVLVFLFIALYITTQIFQVKYSYLMKGNNTIELKVDSNNNVIVPDATDIAKFNYKLGTLYWVLSIALTLAIPLYLIVSGSATELKLWLKDHFRRNNLIIILYIFSIFTFLFLTSLPLSFFRGYYKMKLIGISNESLFSWIIRVFKSFLINSITTTFIGFLCYKILNKAKKCAYLIIGLLTLPLYIMGTLIYPLYIDPVFNEFKPLENKILEYKIKDLANRADIKDLTLYEVDKSKETKAMNAYMSGVGNTKRIVLWDNTIKGLSEGETLVVAAHEMGHYKLKHIPKSIFMGALYSIFLLYLTEKFSRAFINKKGNKLKIYSIKDLAAIPIIILYFSLFSLLLTPISNGYTRYQEWQADKFAIELTEDNFSNATVEVKFLQNNISVPNVNGFIKFFRYDHPTPKERIEFSNGYNKFNKIP